LAVPTRQEIASIALRAFPPIVRHFVRVMRNRQLLYNAKVIRSDANYDIAKRIRPPPRGARRYDRDYTAIHGWCGTDGSLLEPVAPMPGEAFDDLEATGRPLLENARDLQLEHGIPLVDTVPVGHASDTYGKHVNAWPRVYDAVWHQLRVTTVGISPRGPVAGVDIAPAGARTASNLCTFAGEPAHEIIGHRRNTSTLTNDGRDINADHGDAINRLSAELPPGQETTTGDPPSLAAAGRALLLRGVEEKSAAYTAAVQRDQEGAAQLRKFFASPRARDSRVWMEDFGARPPRGLLARLARRAKMALHPDAGFWNYRTREEFRREIDTVQRWYTRGRRLHRPTRGIDRVPRAMRRMGVALIRRRAAMTEKLKAHYARLQRPLREDGLWQWRLIALAYRAASEPLQTGTVCVERLWSILKQFLPEGARRIGLPWFSFLADLMYLRYNYMHFNHQALPSWTDNDALLAVRGDTILAIARGLNAQNGEQLSSLLEALAQAYADPTRVQTPPRHEEGSAFGAESAGSGSIQVSATWDPYLNEFQSDEVATWDPYLLAIDPAPPEGCAASASVATYQRRGLNWQAAHRSQHGGNAPCNTGALAPQDGGLISAPVLAPARSSPSESVFLRVLLPTWSSAFASGKKRVEVARYHDFSRNAMKFAQEGSLLAFGTNAAWEGLALLQGPAKQGNPATEYAELLPFVASDLQAELVEFLQGHDVYDYVVVSTVWDLRPCGLAWSDLVTTYSATDFKNRQGFPRLGGAELKQRLLALGQARGVERSHLSSVE